jgi:putative ABC transport system permease protein
MHKFDVIRRPFLQPHRWLIRFIGVLVPRRLRTDWRQEWEAELQYRETLLAEWDKLDSRNKLDLLWHSAGAFADALSLQPRRLEDEMFQDLRYGVRMLLKQPGFTLIAVLTLGLGIGANTAIFSVVNAVLLRALPFKDTGRLVALWESNPQNPQNEVAAANFLDWRAQNQVFEQLAALSYASVALTGEAEPERLQAVVVTPSFFATLGAQARLGRTFLPAEERPDAPRVVVLSHDLWQRRFAADPNLIGKTIMLNGLNRTVVGVMPPGFQLQFPTQRQVDLWLPRIFTTTLSANRTAHFLYVFARLKPNVTTAQAQGEMETLARRLAEQYPNSNTNVSVRLNPLQTQIVGKVRRPLLILLGAVACVLLIACANIANLLLGRAAVRQREFAIRAALGATRLRVIRQLLTESVMLAGLGGALGLLLAFWGIRLLIAISPATLPRLQEVGIDGQVLGFTLLVSLLTGLVFGLVPALQASRLDLNASLKEGQRSAIGGLRQQLRGLLVGTEVALALVLLTGAGLLLRSFWHLLEVNPGFKPDHVLAMDIALPGAKYGKAEQQAAFFEQSLRRVESLPGVVSAAAGLNLPLSGSNATTGVTPDDRPIPAPSDVSQIDYRLISPNYFRTLGIPLRAGRDFSERDAPGNPPVAIINESLAHRFWPNEDAVGKRLTVRENPPVSCEVIGVAGDVKHYRLDAEAKAEIYVPYLQRPNDFMHIVVRTAADPLQLVGALRRELAAVDKDQPVHNIKTMEQLLAESIAQPNFNLRLLGIFAAVALLLAAVGIYGVVSYLVTQRTHEIGIRLALGARAQDVLKLVVKQGMSWALGGVALGLIASFALTRLMEGLLFGVRASDPLTFMVITLLLSGIAFVACWVPARRATKVDPLSALRQE